MFMTNHISHTYEKRTGSCHVQTYTLRSAILKYDNKGQEAVTQNSPNSTTEKFSNP